MIEADGNGGIFSAPVDFSLLSCTSPGINVMLEKKFGSWDEKKENLGKFPIYLTSRNGIFIAASAPVSNDINIIIIYAVYQNL